jgi:hypothetical protein
MRELSIGELETVSGGYKFCWDGPAGTGTYPDYADCGLTWGDVIGSIVAQVNQIVQQGK